MEFFNQLLAFIKNMIDTIRDLVASIRKENDKK